MELPDLENLVAGFNENPKPSSPKSAAGNNLRQKQPVPMSDPKSKDELWDIFLEAIKTKDKTHTGQKIYNIDTDLVETINQCRFNATTTHVINSILRIFIMSNLPRMVELRKDRPTSLFDKYLTQNIDAYEDN